MKLNPLLIYLLTGKFMRNTKNTNKYAILVYGHVDILWTYQGDKIKMMLLAWLCRFNETSSMQINLLCINVAHIFSPISIWNNKTYV